MAETELVRCPACGANNRVRPDRVAGGEAAVCGRCKSTLPAGGVPIDVNDATFANLVDQSDVPVLLDLWAPWCGPCRMLAPTLSSLAAEWGGRARVAKLNVDENPATAARFMARSIPLLVVMKNGREVDRLVGLRQADEIRRTVARHL